MLCQCRNLPRAFWSHLRCDLLVECRSFEEGIGPWLKEKSFTLLKIIYNILKYSLYVSISDRISIV